MSRSDTLRAVILAAAEKSGRALKDLTVLSPQHDPYRQDMPVIRAAGEWFAEHADRLLGGGRKLHLRGFHYALLGETTYDGSPYVNDDPHWIWLQERAADGARWLGLVPFDAIVDKRNTVPVIRIVEQVDPVPFVSVGDVEVRLPGGPGATRPDRCHRRNRRQPASRASALPARDLRREGQLFEAVVEPPPSATGPTYLPTGCASDSMIHTLAHTGAEDGRRTIVFYLSDSDPAGWNMAVEVARKLQAFRDLKFPGLEFELHPIALTPDQVREYGLPVNAVEGRRPARRQVAGGDGRRANGDRHARHPAARAA